jgi:hypothetical protein
VLFILAAAGMAGFAETRHVKRVIDVHKSEFLGTELNGKLMYSMPWTSGIFRQHIGPANSQEDPSAPDQNNDGDVGNGDREMREHKTFQRHIRRESV